MTPEVRIADPLVHWPGIQRRVADAGEPYCAHFVRLSIHAASRVLTASLRPGHNLFPSASIGTGAIQLSLKDFAAGSMASCNGRSNPRANRQIASRDWIRGDPAISGPFVRDNAFGGAKSNVRPRNVIYIRDHMTHLQINIASNPIPYEPCRTMGFASSA